METTVAGNCGKDIGAEESLRPGSALPASFMSYAALTASDLSSHYWRTSHLTLQEPLNTDFLNFLRLELKDPGLEANSFHISHPKCPCLLSVGSIDTIARSKLGRKRLI